MLFEGFSSLVFVPGVVRSMRSAKSTRTVARQEDNVLAQQLMQNEVGVKPMQRLKK
jgi:hypothetical protein